MEIEILRNLSIIWLSIFCIAGLLVPIVGLYFAIRGMKIATSWLPKFMRTAQEKTNTVRGQADRISNRVAEPILSTQNRVIKAERTVRALGPNRKAE